MAHSLSQAKASTTKMQEKKNQSLDIIIAVVFTPVEVKYKGGPASP